MALLGFELPHVLVASRGVKELGRKRSEPDALGGVALELGEHPLNFGSQLD